LKASASFVGIGKTIPVDPTQHQSFQSSIMLILRRPAAAFAFAALIGSLLHSFTETNKWSREVQVLVPDSQHEESFAVNGVDSVASTFLAELGYALNLSKTDDTASIGESSDYRTAAECRLDLVNKTSPLIGEWLENDVPMLLNLITIDGIHHLQFTLKHITRKQSMWGASWLCNGNETAEVIKRDKLGTDMVLKCREPALTTISVALTSENVTSIQHYDVRTLIKCEQLVAKERPPSDVKIGACTSIKDVRKSVEQWVEYHRIIGIEHFWIYVNEPWNELKSLPQRPYITYIPYGYSMGNHHGKEKKKLKYYNFFQSIAEMDCIYRSKSLGFDWVAMHDVDEYIQVMSNSTQNKPALKGFLDSFPNHENIGAVTMNSIPFGRNTQVERKNETGPLIMDYVWRNQKNPSDVKWGRWKNIINPRNVEYFFVHYIFKGGKQVRLNAGTQMRVNHYKNAKTGVFETRDPKALVRDSAFPDSYREQVMLAMGQNNLTDSNPSKDQAVAVSG
jgi:hypothetical protein